jgi:phosphate butyryltransferase
MMSRLIHIEELVKQRQPGRIVVAAAHDDHVLESIGQITAKGYARAILIGDKDKIISLADEQQVDISGMDLVKELDDRKCADLAVNLVNSGEADVIMKGLMQTADLLKAVLERDKGLRTGALLSHVGAYEIDSYPKLLFITDGGINIAPDLKQKIEIIRNAVDVARSLGVDQPKVAVLAAIETVNPAMPSTLDGAALAMMARRGQIKGCLIDGPLAMDNAINLEAAQHKHIISDVAGDADILLVPDIESGNILVKTLVFLFKARSCSVIAGARVPLVVTSRAESSDAKYNSILLALAMLGQNVPERKGS